MGCFPPEKFLLVLLQELVNVTLNMKRLFTLIVLLAFTVGMIGCSPSGDGTTAPENTATNAPAAPEAPAAEQ
jgi:hypothetical protein